MFDWLEATPFGNTLTVFEIIITIGSLWSGGALGGKAVATQRLRTEHRSHIRVEVLPHIPFTNDEREANHVGRVWGWIGAVDGARARIATLPTIDRIAWSNIERAIPNDLRQIIEPLRRDTAYFAYYAAYELNHLKALTAEVDLFDRYLTQRLRIGPLSSLRTPRYATEILWRRFKLRKEGRPNLGATIEASLQSHTETGDGKRS